MLSQPQLTCKQKEELAFRLVKARVPVDGSKTEGWVTKTERNWHMPSMYYMAVMDCDDEVQETLGQNRYGRIEVVAEMTADYD